MEGGEGQIVMDSGTDAEAPVVKLIKQYPAGGPAETRQDIHFRGLRQVGDRVSTASTGLLYPATRPCSTVVTMPRCFRVSRSWPNSISPEKRVPQDGRSSLVLGRPDIDFRVSVLPAVYGEDA